ncbi:acyl-CoA dehydrogenase [Streptomyces sp. NPDC059740]|uniref:acyl-CoA dehydrogenase n=1 Tax=Streptomyces sp. NPDC059740 TaxID=3346926 RepID=UPI0036698820
MRSEVAVPELQGAELRARVAAGFADLVAGGWDPPLPGAGRTWERFAALAEVAGRDLSLARLAEGHADAAAVLHEIAGRLPAAGERWGVWAAQPPGTGLRARRTERGWVLDGLKAYCSGASALTHALVTAAAPDGNRLFAVRVEEPGCRPRAGTWQAIGMAGSDTPDVDFTDVSAEPVGGVDAYLDRPGFQHGGIGVAACWWGGAEAVARTLYEAVDPEAPEPHAAAHLGEVETQLHAARAVLEQAAREIDEDPRDLRGQARLRSLRVRALVAEVCSAVLRHTGRATGAGPLCHDAAHARRVADLEVYVRQHHAERNLAELGALVGRRPVTGGAR